MKFINLLASRRSWVMSLAVFFGFVPTWAVPTLYPDQMNHSIVNRTDSAYIADSLDGRRFYVLPPQSATMQATGLQAVTANTGFCQELSEIQKYNLETLQMLNELKQKEVQLLKEHDLQEREIRKARAELAQYATANQLVEYSLMRQQIEDTQKRIDALYEQTKQCQPDVCQLILKEIQNALSSQQFFQTEMNRFISDKTAAAQEYERRRQIIANNQEQYKERAERISTLKASLQQMYADYIRMYQAHALREGGQATFQYDSGWEANVQRLSFDNSFYAFEKIPTQKAVIRAGAFQSLSTLPGGSVMAFSVAGAKAQEALHLPAFPETFSALATLNLLGVCPLLYPDLFGFDRHDPRVDPKKLKYGLTVSYEYPVEFKFNLDLKYNMYKMYEIVKSQGSQGGFFGSKKWSYQDEKNMFRDSFDVQWRWNSEKPWLTVQQQLAIESDIRTQLMSRLGAQLKIKNDSPSELSISDGGSPRAGALVLADSLAQTCPSVGFCRAASLGLNLLHSVFSSSQITQQMKQSLNVEMRESYSQNQIQMQSMLTSYKPL